MDARKVPVSLLVAPRLSGDYRLDRDPRTVEWLTDRRAGGDAIVLHGYDDAATKKRRGEFAMLRAHEANLRLMAADRVLEHLGLRTRLFAAPGWVVSPGVVKALPRQRLSAARRSARDHRPGPAHHRPHPGAGHRRGLPDRAVVVPHGGAVRRADRPPRRRSCGSRSRPVSCASPARCRRCWTPSTWRRCTGARRRCTAGGPTRRFSTPPD